MQEIIGLKINLCFMNVFWQSMHNTLLQKKGFFVISITYKLRTTFEEGKKEERYGKRLLIFEIYNIFQGLVVCTCILATYQAEFWKEQHSFDSSLSIGFQRAFIICNPVEGEKHDWILGPSLDLPINRDSKSDKIRYGNISYW